MKIGIAERMSPCEQLWAESEDRHTFAHTNGMEASLDDSTACAPTSQETEEVEEEEVKPKRSRGKVRRITQAMRRETLEF
jgi:hypothetical protein